MTDDYVIRDRQERVFIRQTGKGIYKTDRKICIR